jgi:hypothetical protein
MLCEQAGLTDNNSRVLKENSEADVISLKGCTLHDSGVKKENGKADYILWKVHDGGARRENGGAYVISLEIMQTVIPESGRKTARPMLHPLQVTVYMIMMAEPRGKTAKRRLYPSNNADCVIAESRKENGEADVTSFVGCTLHERDGGARRVRPMLYPLETVQSCPNAVDYDRV